MAALEGLGFAVDWFDRGSYRREEPAEVARLRARGDARALGSRATCRCCATAKRNSMRCSRSARSRRSEGPPVEALLGLAPSGAPIFAALLADERWRTASGRQRWRSRPADPGRTGPGGSEAHRPALDRDRRPRVPHDQAAMLAAAKALMHWHARHRLRQLRARPRTSQRGAGDGSARWYKATDLPGHRSGRHHARGRRRRCVLGRQPEVPEGHVFGAGRIRRARGRRSRLRSGARSGRRPASLRRGRDLRFAALAVPASRWSAASLKPGPEHQGRPR